MTMELAAYLDGRIRVIAGDITMEHSDAIVNAANKSLYGGGGVDGAIHKAGGPTILEECRQLRANLYEAGLPTGEAVITTAGKLNARHVIHTVGPIYGSEGGNEDSLLTASYQNCLRLSDKHSLKSISFPSISTGAFGFPKPLAAKLAAEAVSHEIETLKSIKTVRLVFFSDSDAQLFISNCGL
jgi:O-acetyl-ADP-ribose deacetylase (regulator of RNase III)